MAGPGNMIPDAIAKSFTEEPPVKQQRVWPEDSLTGLSPTGYPDLKTNPSIDTRNLMNSVEQVARRHWWTKDTSGPVGAGGLGSGASSQPSYAPKFPTGGTDKK